MEGVNRAAGGERRGEGPLPQHHRRHDGGDVRARRVRQGARARNVVMIDLVIGWTAIQSMSKWAAQERHAAAHAPRGALDLHAAEGPRRQLPGHLQVAAPRRRRPPARRHRRRQARGRQELRARLLRRAARAAQRGQPRARPVLRAGLGAGCARSCRSPPAASTPVRCTSCSTCSATTCVLQFGGGTIGHPEGIAAGRHRQPRRARGDGQGAQRGPRHPRRRARRSSPTPPQWCKPLRAALDTWGEVTFDYASTDTLDVVPTPTSI